MSVGPHSLSDLDQWVQTGLQVCKVERTALWNLGEWWNFGSRFGRVRVRIVNSPEWKAGGGHTHNTCRAAGSLARRFSPPCRRLHTGIAFHQSVRALPDDVALPLLDRAAREGWELDRMRVEVETLKMAADHSQTGRVVRLETDLVDQILLGDCRVLLPQLPANSVSTVISSPPFHGARDYHGLGIGNETLISDYLDELLAVLMECFRVSCGTVAFNLGDRRENNGQLMIPEQFALAVLHRMPDVRLVNDVTWFRPNGQPQMNPTGKHLANQTQHWYIWTKHPTEYHFDTSEWNPKPPPQQRHHTPRLGAKYRKIITETETLNDVEKRNAWEALDEAIDAVRSGEYPQFRMRIRGVHAKYFGGQSGGVSNRVETEGFCITSFREVPPPNDLVVHPAACRRGNRHPAIFPVELATDFIKLLCPVGGTVLDPFIGSGTTAEAAIECGRHYLGMEIDPSYHAEAVARMRR